MTLAPSSPPCSQMCPYSCRWMTPPCTSLSLLTWGCPCAAWRFSTNHWPLSSTTPLPLNPALALPNSFFSAKPTPPPPPHCALPSQFLWHFLCVAGWSNKLNFSLLCSDFLSIMTSLPSQPVRRKRIPYFSFHQRLHLHVIFHVCLSFGSVLTWCDVSINNWLVVWWYTLSTILEQKWLTCWSLLALVYQTLEMFCRCEDRDISPRCIVAPLIMMLFSCAPLLPLSPTPLHYLGKFCLRRAQTCNQSSAN